MNGKIEPSAWAKLPETAKDDIIRQAQWYLHVKREAGKDRIYDTILLTLQVDTDPKYQAIYRDYVNIRSEYPYAGSSAFVEVLRDMAQHRPEDTALNAQMKNIDAIYGAAMGIAESRLARGTALSQ
jgi:hypothetical protein